MNKINNKENKKLSKEIDPNVNSKIENITINQNLEDS